MSDDSGSGVKWLVGIVVAVAAGVVVPLYLANRSDSPPSSPQPGVSVPAGVDVAGPAHLYLNRTSGPAGAQIVVSGDGFKPGEQVIIRFHTEEVGRTSADEAGKFQGVEVTVPASYGKFAPQQFNLTATGEQSIKSGSAVFTISG